MKSKGYLVNNLVVVVLLTKLKVVVVLDLVVGLLFTNWVIYSGYGYIGLYSLL